VPLVPAGGDVATAVLIQILAEQAGSVTGVVEAGGEVIIVVACRLERVYAAVGAVVGDDAGVVRVLPAQDRRARGAACGEGSEGVGEGRTLADQLLFDLRHLGEQGEIGVVGEDKQDVRLLACFRCQRHVVPAVRLPETRDGRNQA
jgi:hypothetical protein